MANIGTNLHEGVKNLKEQVETSLITIQQLVADTSVIGFKESTDGKFELTSDQLEDLSKYLKAGRIAMEALSTVDTHLTIMTLLFKENRE